MSEAQDIAALAAKLSRYMSEQEDGAAQTRLERQGQHVGLGPYTLKGDRGTKVNWYEASLDMVHVYHLVRDKDGSVWYRPKGQAQYVNVDDAIVRFGGRSFGSMGVLNDGESRMLKRAVLHGILPGQKGADPNWDADNGVVAVANGVLDLRAGRLLDGDGWPELQERYGGGYYAGEVAEGHILDYRIRDKLAVRYDPAARCLRLLHFLEVALPDPRDRAAALDMAAHSILKRKPMVQGLWLHYGNGANGKSVYQGVVAAMLGGANTYNVDWAAAGGYGRDYFLAELLRVRASLSDEVTLEAVPDEILKAAAGQAEMGGREIYKKPTSSKINVTVSLPVNRVPAAWEGRDAMTRRAWVVWWRQKFDKQIGLIPDRSVETIQHDQGELSGLLNLVLPRVRAMLRDEWDGPDTAGDLGDIIASQAAAPSGFAEWMDACGLRIKPEVRDMPRWREVLRAGGVDGRAWQYVDAAGLHRMYRAWCADNDIVPLEFSEFKAHIRREAGYGREYRRPNAEPGPLVEIKLTQRIDGRKKNGLWIFAPAEVQAAIDGQACSTAVLPPPPEPATKDGWPEWAIAYMEGRLR